MICIISTFSKLLFLGYGAFLGTKWIFKTVKSNKENIYNTICSVYNLPETTYQKLRVRVNKNNFS